MENKLIIKIQQEYFNLLKKYEQIVLSGNMTISEIKIMIEEVQVFWYKHNACITYFLNNITGNDRVAYLAGAVRLDIKNDGHYEFGVIGNYRIVNEPIVKMSAYYKPEGRGLNYNYINQYLKDTFVDIMLLLENYADDFWILPLDLICENERDVYLQKASKLAETILLQFFKKSINSLEDFNKKYFTYEDVESNLVDGAMDYLIFNDFTDANLSLRERIERHIKKADKILPEMNLTEAEIFVMLTHQYLMQILDILNVAIQFHMCPFIRNDIVFSYFLLIYTNYHKEFDREVAYEAFIGFISQKTLDLSEFDYNQYKNKFMKRKLVEYTMDKLPIQEKDIVDISIQDVVQIMEQYVRKAKI